MPFYWHELREMINVGVKFCLSIVKVLPKMKCILCILQAIFKPPKAIRGGIPICFPQVRAFQWFSFLLCFVVHSGQKNLALHMQFASLGSLESHGFARNRFWSIDADPPPFPTNSSSKAFVDLILMHSEEDMKIWPHRWDS